MTDLVAGQPASASASRCFHCGEPLAAKVVHHAMLDGTMHPMCCAGCKAVAEAIAGAGLGGFYQTRTVHALRANDPSGNGARDLRALDSAAYQKHVVETHAEHRCSVSLLIDGITCAACVWLIEQRLRALAGVLDATVNFSNWRARVCWDSRRTRLSEIVAALQAIGYGAEPYDSARAESGRRRDQRASLWRLFVAAFGMMQIMMYAIPAYLADGDLPADLDGLMRWASLALTIPVIAFAAAPFFSSAWRDLRHGRLGMNVPVALGLAVTFAASVYATAAGRGPVYFDSIAMFVFLLLAARHFETVLRARAGEALERVSRLIPAFATRLNADEHGAASERVAVADIVPGDRLLIRAGESVPADGVVLSGDSRLNESLLTGESQGVHKRAGDRLIGGSVNLTSRLIMRVEQVGSATVVAGIGRLLERASAGRPRIAQLADRIAAPFTAMVLIVAALAAGAWWLIDPAQALPIAVTVLVITCPCALSLAAPAAVAAANGALARRGVLVTRAEALETLAQATHVVLDKTGTVTTGKLGLIDVINLGGNTREHCLQLAAALERHSAHPLASAILQSAVRPLMGSDPETHDVAGNGIEALIDQRRVRIGRPSFVADLVKRPLPAQLAVIDDRVQVVALGDERGWIGLFTFADAIRAEAKAVVQFLRAQGAKVWLLSGDRQSVTEHVGRVLGVDGVCAGADPQDKQQFVQALQSRGEIVAMVGDGVNDAPVLVQAQVSIAMGEGADAAQCGSDIVLIDGGLRHLVDTLGLARRTQRVIKQNLAWAMLYNAVAIPAAVSGWVSPLSASIGMAASSAIVIANALRAARPALWLQAERRKSADVGPLAAEHALGSKGL